MMIAFQKIRSRFFQNMSIYQVNLCLQIIILYAILLFGALWQILDRFQTLRSQAAAPLLTALTIWIVIAYTNTLKRHGENRTISLIRYFKFLSWSAVVLIGGFVAELVGVRTGKLFGNYSYGEVLQPQFWGVPVAIGFAWLAMMLSSIAVTKKMFFENSSSSPLLSALITGILMVAFDMVMEPASIELGYWSWQNAIIPVKNYLTWFSISFIFAWLGYRLKIFGDRYPKLAIHAYLAQLLYFTLILIF